MSNRCCFNEYQQKIVSIDNLDHSDQSSIAGKYEFHDSDSVMFQNIPLSPRNYYPPTKGKVSHHMDFVVSGSYCYFISEARSNIYHQTSNQNFFITKLMRAGCKVLASNIKISGENDWIPSHLSTPQHPKIDTV